MKRLKFIILASLLLASSLQSCDDTLDINTDPLAASSADPNAVLPYVFVQYSARKVPELGTRICDVSQYISNTFNSPNRGSVSSFLTGNTWGMYYVQALGNLSLVKADAAAAGETSNNVNAIATVLMAHVFYEATSLWEDVPFTEALNGAEFPNPKFDSQETVLNGVVDLYDEAIALIDAIPASGNFQITANSDMFYGGDMTSWRRLANSLKLRTLMMLKSGGANVDAKINETLNQPLIESNSQSAIIRYSGQPGAQNAMLTIITRFFGPDNESQDVFGPGDPIDELLRDSGDPRYDLWVARNDLPAPGNDLFPDPTTSVLSNNIIRADLPDMFIMPAEIDLYKAQLAFEGVAAAGDAETNYKNGIRNAIKWWGQDIPGAIATVSNSTIDSYVNGLPSPSINDIYNQQYLAAFLQPVMAWNIWRINKVPVLSPPPNSSIGTVLRRFVYPPDEIAANPNTPADKPTQEPMWFEN
ncbi:SusD/RagB family nutrient-binding outer membrane lipoprotein [Aestuariivivens insulae]|uniref:SusD/RagB family nutrient-binding outer membrane lipoprotein n=1 Tax=Aestuariivivens insulae TaxID=1621988 RepID=UPI001F5AC0B6|nr:SusD/RagB family nutrient-binding outer membrane lipoprotein [Aestuariivivens insulae]